MIRLLKLIIVVMLGLLDLNITAILFANFTEALISVL